LIGDLGGSGATHARLRTIMAETGGRNKNDVRENVVDEMKKVVSGGPARAVATTKAVPALRMQSR
jgi:hypothetical protein